jgi:hypothetical protein
MKFKEFDETNPAPNEFAADMVKGDFYITPGVVNKFKPSEVRQVVLRHMRLDWQDMDPEDRELNLAAAMEGNDRVLGAYRIHVTREQDTDLWIVTEADRSATTILLPDEY